jgi:hypothetical protein
VVLVQRLVAQDLRRQVAVDRPPAGSFECRESAISVPRPQSAHIENGDVDFVAGEVLDELGAGASRRGLACGFSESVRSGTIELFPSGTRSTNGRW